MNVSELRKRLADLPGDMDVEKAFLKIGFSQITLMTRLEMLVEIGEAFLQCCQWSEMHDYKGALKYYCLAEKLIDIIEVKDCGSIGGFDEGQPDGLDLFGRYEWIFNKFHKAKDAIIDHMTFKELKKRFYAKGSK